MRHCTRSKADVKAFKRGLRQRELLAAEELQEIASTVLIQAKQRALSIPPRVWHEIAAINGSDLSLEERAERIRAVLEPKIDEIEEILAEAQRAFTEGHTIQ